MRETIGRPEQVRQELARDRDTIDRVRRLGGRGVAVGRLLDDAGELIIGQLSPGGSKGAEGLTERYRSMRFAHHVEATVTAIMRQRGIRHATPYINKRPCKGDESCYENLEATLPVGYRLTVRHVGPASGGNFDFYGNGKGLEP